MTIIQIDPLETGQHPIQSQSGRRACWLEGYIEVPRHLHDAVWATYGWCDLQIERAGCGYHATERLQSRSRSPNAHRRGHHSGHAGRARGTTLYVGNHHQCCLKKGKDMNTVFNLCKLLIDRGRTDGLQDKIGCLSRRRPAHPGGVPGAGRATGPGTVINSGIAG